jgi:hypothetical protein
MARLQALADMALLAQHRVPPELVVVWRFNTDLNKSLAAIEAALVIILVDDAAPAFIAAIVHDPYSSNDSHSSAFW